jgi:tRNA/rRNA methyltransferase
MPAAPAAPASTRFVLVEPAHAANVGAAARAMKVMGFADLWLVRPRRRDIAAAAEAVAMASGAHDVLDGVRTAATLEEALAGVTWAAATAMTPRDFGPPVAAPREAFAARATGGMPGSVAFVFGPERTGLSNEDVWRCHACLSIPTAPGFGSLNLAQAVQVIAYEWRLAQGGFVVEPRAPPERAADVAAVERLLDHWRDTLEAIGVLDPAAPRRLLPRLRRLLQRARPTVEEVHILRGIARAAKLPRRLRPGASSEGAAGPTTPDTDVQPPP